MGIVLCRTSRFFRNLITRRCSMPSRLSNQAKVALDASKKLKAEDMKEVPAGSVR